MPTRSKKQTMASSKAPYYLRIKWNAPSEFHNQQFGRHHGFQVELELRRRAENTIVKDIVLDLKPTVYYSKENGAEPGEAEKVKDQEIIVFLQRNPPRIIGGEASFKMRIKEVSKNHMKRKFQIKLEQVGKARSHHSAAGRSASGEICW